MTGKKKKKEKEKKSVICVCNVRLRAYQYFHGIDQKKQKRLRALVSLGRHERRVGDPPVSVWARRSYTRHTPAGRCS